MMLQQIVQHLHGFEIENITLMAGVIVATVQRRYTGINPGGLISCAFIIMAAELSLFLAASILLVGYVISVVYKRFFSHIFSGREPMFYMAFMSVVAMFGVSALLRYWGLAGRPTANYLPGLIVPAILANAIIKQGVNRTFTHLFAATLITFAVLVGVYETGLSAGHNFYALDTLIAQRKELNVYSGSYMALASIIIGFVIYKKRQIKFAGYVMLPFLATLLLSSPLNFALVMGLTVVAYLITMLVRNYTLVIGIGRYAFVLLLSAVLVWTAEIVLLRGTTHFSPFLGTTIFASLAIAVIVNDTTIFGVKRSIPAFLTGMTATTLLLAAVHQTPRMVHAISAYQTSQSQAASQKSTSFVASPGHSYK